MAEERRSGGMVGEGIRTGIGILTAFKEAIEETLEEAVDRGDLSPDRAKEAMKDAARRVQVSLDDARDRLDVVPRREFELLRAEVTALRARVERIESSGGTASPAPLSGGDAGTGTIPVD